MIKGNGMRVRAVPFFIVRWSFGLQIPFSAQNLAISYLRNTDKISIYTQLKCRRRSLGLLGS